MSPLLITSLHATARGEHVCVPCVLRQAALEAQSSVPIDVDVTARALKPAHIKAHQCDITATPGVCTPAISEQCTDHKPVSKSYVEAKYCGSGL